MLVLQINEALNQKRTFDTSLSKMQLCSDFNELETYLPSLFNTVDHTLFDGALQKFLDKKKISFQIEASTKGPAGMTTYDETSGMKIILNRNAWVNEFPAMVGGNLCTRADKCITQTFFHEIVHVILFCVYLELGMTQNIVEQTITTNHDPTHNIIFTTWLDRFFHQPTIDNSLLLQSKQPLRFSKNVVKIEKECIQNENNTKQVFYQGVWQDATIKKNQSNVAPHHSRVRTRNGHNLIIPNGLITC